MGGKLDYREIGTYMYKRLFFWMKILHCELYLALLPRQTSVWKFVQ